jgi:hypothetical protein
MTQAKSVALGVSNFNSSGVLGVAGGGTGSSTGYFASGTALVFKQTAAPTGWTKLTTDNDAALRIVSGSVSTGGTVGFTTAFASQAVTGTVGTTGSTTAVNNSYTPAGSVSTSVGSTTLSAAQMPSHSHGWSIQRYDYPWEGVAGREGVTAGTTSSGSDTLFNGTGGAGSDNSHNHSGSSSFSGTPATITQAAHTHTGGTFTGTAINLAVKYVDVIVATKD